MRGLAFWCTVESYFARGRSVKRLKFLRLVDSGVPFWFPILLTDASATSGGAVQANGSIVSASDILSQMD